MLHAGASHCTRVLQKYRWPSWQLGFQPPPPEHTHITHRRCPWRVCPHPRSPRLLLMTIQHPLLSRCLPRLILVDSTRAGKRLPDALSKTVPIWCAVVNRATRMRGLVSRRRTTAGEQEEEAEEETAVDLHTPPGAVSAHEHAQIAARIDGWATALAVRWRNHWHPYCPSLPQYS